MTQEQKAKAYDRALKYAMIYYTNGSENMKMMMKTCFPILVEENEDEEIKKSLIHLVHLYGGEFGMIDANTSVEKAVSWIEKQDEQKSQRMISSEAKEAMYSKPTDLEEFINELFKQFPDVSFAKLSRIAVRVAKWAKPTDEEMKELLRTEYEKGRADAIAEMQKPADSHCSDCTNAKGCVNCSDGDMKETGKSAWSIEDGKSLNRIVGALKCMVMDYNVDDEETLEKDISWLKSLKERL